jgi:rare lipoprotein A (peptidoglycan hydrolase)
MDTELGKRDLKVGDCGVDVETLNWILKAKDFGAPPLTDEFDDPTAEAVSEFQGTADLRSNGIFDSTTAAALFRAMPSQVATWYGPGLYGRQTACGQTLTPRTIGVAHKTLPCGSRVVIRYRGRFVRTTVIDRGPYANGASWDLTQATARALHFTSVGIDDVRVAKLAPSTKPTPG